MSNPDITLTAQTPLNGFNQSFDGIEVAELQGYSLVSMAMPADQKTSLAKYIKEAYKAEVPEVGKFIVSDVDNTHILGLQLEQNFLLFENNEVYANGNAVAHIQEKTKDAAYLSDQSDSWAMLTISGENARTALERICPIDLHHSSHPQTFSTFSVTRTAMEHLAVIIMQTDENEFLLLSPRSSAESFLHMILTSIENIS